MVKVMAQREAEFYDQLKALGTQLDLGGLMKWFDSYTAFFKDCMINGALAPYEMGNQSMLAAAREMHKSIGNFVEGRESMPSGGIILQPIILSSQSLTPTKLSFRIERARIPTAYGLVGGKIGEFIAQDALFQGLKSGVERVIDFEVRPDEDLGVAVYQPQGVLIIQEKDALRSYRAFRFRDMGSGMNLEGLGSTYDLESALGGYGNSLALNESLVIVKGGEHWPLEETALPVAVKMYGSRIGEWVE